MPPALSHGVHMEITINRNEELLRESRHLPAAVYNAGLLLLAHNPDGVVFVPIRNMQYLAVIDHEEIIFLDSENKNWVEIAWQNFRPQARTALTDPVPYESVFYKPGAKVTMSRLLFEFPAALKSLAAKDVPTTGARIIKLDRGKAAG
jgi:hypothetical protein